MNCRYTTCSQLLHVQQPRICMLASIPKTLVMVGCHAGSCNRCHTTTSFLSECLSLMLLHLPQPIRILSTGMKAACGAFSPDGQQLAVGMRCGGIKVYEFHPETRQVSSLVTLTWDTLVFGAGACRPE
jgi:hypothetical protein